MTKVVDWVKDHKLSSFLLLVIFFYVLITLPRTQKQTYSVTGPSSVGMMGVARDSVGVTNTAMMGKVAMPPFAQNIPIAETATRMVTTDTNLSLKVNDVSESITKIESVANQTGGYLVDSTMNKPEGAANGTISIRVPSEKRMQVLTVLRGLAVKVVSENVNGQDITDQYVDNDERLRILTETKVKFEAILADAKNIQDMLEVQRELLNLQQQIDSLKGQQQYLAGSAKLSRITVYLSTDELALPYAPDTSWRPSLVFKEAVRSLVMSLRQVGSLAIWAAVYVPVAIVIGIILWVVKKLLQRKTKV